MKRSVWMEGFCVIKLILSIRAAKTNHTSPWTLLQDESKAVPICQMQEGQASVWGCWRGWLCWSAAGSQLCTGSSCQLPPQQGLDRTREVADHKDHSQKTSKMGLGRHQTLLALQQGTLLFKNRWHCISYHCCSHPVFASFNLEAEGKLKNSQSDVTKSDMSYPTHLTEKEKRLCFLV